MADTLKNVVAAVNEGVANVAERAQEALGTVHDKAADSAQTGPQKVDEVGVALRLLLLLRTTPARCVMLTTCAAFALPPYMQMAQSAAETRDQAADKAAELKDQAADKAGEVRLRLMVMRKGPAGSHALNRSCM
jgi:hypothetical protein